MKRWIVGLFVRRFEVPAERIVEFKLIHMAQQVLGMTPSGPDPLPGYTLKMLQADLGDSRVEVEFTPGVSISQTNPFGTLRSRAVNFLVAHFQASEDVMTNIAEVAARRRVIKRKVGV